MKNRHRISPDSNQTILMTILTLIAMINNIIIVSLVIYFVFFLVNRSSFFLPVNLWWKMKVVSAKKSNNKFSPLLDKLDYLKECSFCTTFWMCVILFLLGHIPFFFIVCCPVVNLIIDSVITSSHRD
jgi:hypothetical protein